MKNSGVIKFDPALVEAALVELPVIDARIGVAAQELIRSGGELICLNYWTYASTLQQLSVPYKVISK